MSSLPNSELSRFLQSATIENIEREIKRRSYLEWLRGHIPSGWEVDVQHIREIASHIDDVLAGRIDRLALAKPPRHAKSETVTVRLPARILDYSPKSNILITGYNERIARRFSRKAKVIAEAAGIALNTSKKSVDEWETADGGLVMARGVGSPPTGVGFQYIIIDDPIAKREQADSEVYRERLKDWYSDDLYTRLEPGGAIILIQTRWHHDDLWSYATSQEPGSWVEVIQPAISDAGDALWPERYPIEALERIRDVMTRDEGQRSWEALYQQNPTPQEGDKFHVSKFQFLDAIPQCLRWCRAWDAAASKSSGDSTASVKMGVTADGIYVIADVTNAQLETSERDRTMRLHAELDGQSCRVGLPQDPGAAGKAQLVYWSKAFAGFAFEGMPTTGDKSLRASPYASQVNAGNVALVRGPWNADFVEQHRQFPNGKHDDMVDAAGDAFKLCQVSGAKVYDPRTGGMV